MPERTCDAPDCLRAAVAKGYCGMHYARWKRHGSLAEPSRKQPAKLCTFDGCARRLAARGLCAAHYAQQRKGQDLHPLPNYAAECTASGCGRSPIARGYCTAHYQQHTRGLDLTEPQFYGLSIEERFDRSCSVDPETGCIVWNSERLDLNGYGRLYVSLAGRRRGFLAHRLAFALHHGIPLEAMTKTNYPSIDHLCRNRACVNVDHLEAVSVQENTRRMNAFWQERARAERAERTVRLLLVVLAAQGGR